MKTKPRNGIWGNDNIWNAYQDLQDSLEELIPDHAVGLHISGTASMARAKGKAIIAKAKILNQMISAVCIGRK